MMKFHRMQWCFYRQHNREQGRMIPGIQTGSTKHTGHIAIDEVVTTVIMARVTGFFGFFVYAIASALVFPRVFFPDAVPVTGTLYSFVVFSFAFPARLPGELLAGYLRKKLGRGAVTALAAMIFGSSTVAIGLLPGYGDIGWTAPVLLALLRIGQGIGLGAGRDNISLCLQHAAPANRKGLYAMIPQIGGPAGFCAAASLFFVLTGFLTDEEFFSWGWRFAFFGVFAVNVVSLFARLRLLGAGFGNSDEPAAIRFADVVRTQWRPVLLSAFIPLASYALFHMVTVFPLGYLVLYTDSHVPDILLLELAGGTLAVFSVILSGVLADRYGSRSVRIISTFLIAVLALSIGMLDTFPAFFIISGFILLGFSHGQTGTVATGRYPQEHLFAASALATHLAWIIGAAFAPLAGLLLTVHFGLAAAGGYMLSGVLATSLALVLSSRQEKRTGQTEQ